jgi:hypothetical protein
MAMAMARAAGTGGLVLCTGDERRVRRGRVCNWSKDSHTQRPSCHTPFSGVIKKLFFIFYYKSHYITTFRHRAVSKGSNSRSPPASHTHTHTLPPIFVRLLSRKAPLPLRVIVDETRKKRVWHCVPIPGGEVGQPVLVTW